MERGGIETVNFSRLLMYIGVHYYIEATHLYAKSFGLDEAIPILIKGKDAIKETVRNNIGKILKLTYGLGDIIPVCVCSVLFR